MTKNNLLEYKNKSLLDTCSHKNKQILDYDIVILDTEHSNEILKHVKRDLLYCHSERALATEESHNFLCSTLAGEPKSLISKGGKISQCSGLLRHSVVKTSHLGINIPHNDMIFYLLHAITRKTSRAECGAACRINRLSTGQVGRLGVTFNARRSEQIGYGLEQSDVVISNTSHQCHPGFWQE